MSIAYTHVDSPIGPLLLSAGERGLHGIHFAVCGRPAKPGTDWHDSRTPLRDAIRQLELYFAGKLRAFDLPLAPEGTPFQLQVWRALRRIPYGATISYGELARRVGRPSASRAVGAANDRRSVPPRHRRRRQPDRIRRRCGHQARAARPGARGGSAVPLGLSAAGQPA
jgi:methylated-DNA-[protein]-cysteine S-methyltransferase